MICKIIFFAVLAVAYTSACGQCAGACSPGLFRVALDNCGPNPLPSLPINLAPACAPAIKKPVVALPVKIPAPKIIGASASCVKTILKPQLLRQLVTVPVINRFLQTLAKPRLEIIKFNAQPICPSCSCGPSCTGSCGCGCSAPVPPCAAPAPVAIPPCPASYAAPCQCAAPCAPAYAPPCAPAYAPPCAPAYAPPCASAYAPPCPSAPACTIPAAYPPCAVPAPAPCASPYAQYGYSC